MNPATRGILQGGGERTIAGDAAHESHALRADPPPGDETPCAAMISIVSNERMRTRRSGARSRSALFAPAVFAQQFPNRTIRVVVPFPAGATTDMLARLIAQRLSETHGPERGGRERRRRRRLDRRRSGREGRARRPHAAVPQHHVLHDDVVAAVRQARAARLRRFRADLGRRLCAAAAAGQPVGAGEGPQGVRRLRQDDQRRRCSTARPGPAASCI